ncbi:MAG: type III secretion system inner membrane ring subunit SctD [Plesiomonas sp.]
MYFKIRFLDDRFFGREVILPSGFVTIGGDGNDISLPNFHGDFIKLDVKYSNNCSGVFLDSNNIVVINDLVFDSKLPLPFMQVIECEGICFLLGDKESNLDVVLKKNTTFNRNRLSFLIATFLYKFSFFGMLFIVFFSCILILNSTVFVKSDVVKKHNTGVLHKNAKAFRVVNNKEKLLNDIKSLNLEGVYAEWLNDGSLRLNGQCRRTSDIDNLHILLARENVIYQDELVCDDQIIKSVSLLLSKNGVSHFSVRPMEKLGGVIIDGDISENEKWRAIEVSLKKIKGLNFWHVINSSVDFIAEWVCILTNQGLLNTVSVVRQDNNIVISGLLTHEQEKKLNIGVDFFYKKFGMSSPVIYQNIPLDSKLESITSSPAVSYQGNKDVSYLRLADGTRIEKGDVISDEYKIVALDEKGIEFLTKKQLIHIPLYF